MKKNFVAVFCLIFMAVIISAGCKNQKTSSPTTVIIVATSTPTKIPTIIDNFEADTPLMTPAQNLLGGSWGHWAAQNAANSQYCSITLTVLTGTGGSGSNALQILANIVGDNFPSITCPTFFTPATYTAVDINTLTTNGYTGIRMKMKLVPGSGSGSHVNYDIQLFDWRIRDGSYWMYDMNTLLVPNTWVTVSVPFSYFNIAGWGGTGDSYTRSDTYANISGIQWAIETNGSGSGNAYYGIQWYLDDIEIY